MTGKPETRKRSKRADGEGTIYKIKTGPRKGTWVGQLTTKVINPKTGRPKRKSFYGDTQGDVRAQMEEYKDQMNQGLDLETSRRLTFGEWVGRWLELYKQPNVRLSTYEGYLGHVRRTIAPALGHIYLADLTSDDIQGLYKKLSKEGKSASTIHKLHVIIKPALEQAVEMRLLPTNPTNSTKPPAVKKGSSSKPKVLSDEDMDKFLSVLDEQDDKWRAAFLTLLGTGLRIGELLALEWDDIDLEAGIINVNKGLSRTESKGLIVEKPKTESSEAPVPVPEFVLQAIKRHKVTQAAWILKQGRKYKNRKLVFPSNRGTYMIPRNFQRKHDWLIDKAKVEHVSVHGLRHTFATRMLEMGENLKTVQELLRHADIKTTGNIYAHVSQKVKKKAAQKMDSLLRRESI